MNETVCKTPSVSAKANFKALARGSNVRANCKLRFLSQAVSNLQGTRGGLLDLNVHTSENSSGRPCGNTLLKRTQYVQNIVNDLVNVNENDILFICTLLAGLSYSIYRDDKLSAANWCLALLAFRGIWHEHWISPDQTV